MAVGDRESGNKRRVDHPRTRVKNFEKPFPFSIVFFFYGRTVNFRPSPIRPERLCDIGSDSDRHLQQRASRLESKRSTREQGLHPQLAAWCTPSTQDQTLRPGPHARTSNLLAIVQRISINRTHTVNQVTQDRACPISGSSVQRTWPAHFLMVLEPILIIEHAKCERAGPAITFETSIKDHPLIPFVEIDLTLLISILRGKFCPGESRK